VFPSVFQIQDDQMVNYFTQIELQSLGPDERLCAFETVEYPSLNTGLKGCCFGSLSKGGENVCFLNKTDYKTILVLLDDQGRELPLRGSKDVID
jgi:hypothetical protein